jgi:hypothetical protein
MLLAATDELYKAQVDKDGAFRYFAPLGLFEKADAPEGQQRRIYGVASTESKDQEDETVLQRGLDWQYFLTKGWFNDNHSRKTGGVVGYPDPKGVQFFKRGDRLPSGEVAKANCHWAEGYLLEGVPAADDIWRIGQALQKAGGERGLGMSIEGKVLRRANGGKTIARAAVRHVAITHCPVNAETSLGFLAKSLVAAEADEPNAEEKAIDSADEDDKALTAGSPSGQALQPESLEREMRTTAAPCRLITKAQAIDVVLRRYPHISCATAGRLVDLHLRGAL